MALSSTPAPAESGPVSDDNLFLPPDDFWENHKTKIFAGLGLLVTAAIAVIFILQWLETQKQSAMADYARANNPEAWREVMAKYAGQPVAGNAALLLAAAQREAGELKEAETIYADLQSSTVVYAMKPLAALGLAEITAASKGVTPSQTAEAYQQAAAAFPNSFVAAYAHYNAGVVQLVDGQAEGAAASFRTVATDYPNSLLARLSAMQLQRLAPANPLPALPPNEAATLPGEAAVPAPVEAAEVPVEAPPVEAAP